MKKKDERIKVVHQKNKGVSGARNTGMSHMTGDYVMFVDGDDELCPNAVETLLHDLVEYSADIVSCASKTVDAEGTVLYDYADGSCSVFKDDEPLLLSLQGRRCTEAVWAKLFKTDLVKDIRFEEGKNINEDIYFMFLCFLKKPVMVHHNVAVYRYNLRQESCSRQAFSNKHLCMLYFLNRKKEILAELYPQYTEQVFNMEVRTNLFLLDILCSSKGNEHIDIQHDCIRTVKSLYKYHKPINKHHNQLAWIIKHNLYPIYKVLIRLKYYR